MYFAIVSCIVYSDEDIYVYYVLYLFLGKRKYIKPHYLFVIDVYLGEGEYIIPRCTVFGLEEEEMKTLQEKGFKWDLFFDSQLISNSEKFIEDHDENLFIITMTMERLPAFMSRLM